MTSQNVRNRANFAMPLQVRLPPEYKARLEQIADKEKALVSQLARKAICDWVDKHCEVENVEKIS